MSYTHYEQLILESINLADYFENEPESDFDRIKAVDEIILEEMGWLVNQVGKFKAISEHLAGLPSYCSVPTKKVVIIKNAEDYSGIKFENSDSKQDYLDAYFDNLSKAFIVLRENL